MALLIAVYLLLGLAVVCGGVVAHRKLSGLPATLDRLAGWVTDRIGDVGGYFSVLIGGLVVSGAIMIPIGLLCRSLQSSVDTPTYHWVHARVAASRFTKINTTLTTMGNRSTIDWIFLVAVVLLAFAYRRRWWVPVSALALSYGAQYEGQSRLAALINRGRPPAAGAGTFPSGGVSRALTLYGVVLALSLVLVPGLSRAWRAGLFTGLALLGYAEAYSRLYLSLHWLSDAVAGLIFGGLIVLTVSLALRCVGRAGVLAPQPGEAYPTERPAAAVSRTPGRPGAPLTD